MKVEVYLKEVKGDYAVYTSKGYPNLLGSGVEVCIPLSKFGKSLPKSLTVEIGGLEYDQGG